MTLHATAEIMSLRSTDIKQVKRLSLSGVKLPEPEAIYVAPPRPEPLIVEDSYSEPNSVELTPLQDREPTYEELLHAKMREVNPAIDELVDSLGLEIAEPEPPEERERWRLILLANKVMDMDRAHSKEALIYRIKTATNVSRDRAKAGIEKFIEAGAVTVTPAGEYVLKVTQIKTVNIVI